MNVQVINKSKHPLPAYATELSAGMDIRANLSEPITLAPLQRCLVPTGIYIALPQGFEAQVRPRSGLAIKKGITVLNSPGTIDADYRGEVCIILVNLSSEPFVIEDGERIAQMVIARHEQARIAEVESLDETARGAGGFGVISYLDWLANGMDAWVVSLGVPGVIAGRLAVVHGQAGALAGACSLPTPVYLALRARRASS